MTCAHVQSLFEKGLVVAGRWYKPMMAKLDNSSPRATMFFYAVWPLHPGDLGKAEPERTLSPDEGLCAARDELGGR